MADEVVEPTENEVTQDVTYRKYIGVSISSLLQEYDVTEKDNHDPNLEKLFDDSDEQDHDDSEINPVSEDDGDEGDDGPDTPTEPEPESTGKYGYGIKKHSTISTRDIESYYGKEEIKSIEISAPTLSTEPEEGEPEDEEEDLEEEDEEQSEPVVQNDEDPSEDDEGDEKYKDYLSIDKAIIRKCPTKIREKLNGLRIGLVNDKLVLINFKDHINFLDKLYEDKEEDYEKAKKEFDDILNRKFYIGFDLKVTFKADTEEETPEEELIEPQSDDPETNNGTESEEPDNSPHDKAGTYITLDKNDGSNQRVTKFYKLNSEYQPKIISELIDELKKEQESEKIKFDERDPSDEYQFTVKGYSNIVNDEKDHTFNKFELNHFTMFFGDFYIYTLWNATYRDHKVVDITVKKNDGTEDEEKISFMDFEHTGDDDVDYIKIEDKLSGSMKNRASDRNYIYHYYGLSETQDGPIINTTEKKFTESTTLYIIWNKEPIIYIEKDSDVDPDSYVKHGNLQFIEGVLFVQPDESEIVKKMVYCNGFYYLLCMNNRIYKLLINDTNRIVTKIFDLSGYNTDINETDIFACDNVLIIKTGKYILTDKETIKSNFGIDDSSLLLKINDTIKKLNTKTIAKIDVK